MRTYTSEGTVYHLDVPRGRQANPQFAHRLDWSKHCTLCQKIEVNVDHYNRQLVNKIWEKEMDL